MFYYINKWCCLGISEAITPCHSLQDRMAFVRKPEGTGRHGVERLLKKGRICWKGDEPIGEVNATFVTIASNLYFT